MKVLETIKDTFLDCLTSFLDKLIDLTYELRDFVAGSFVLACMSGYTPLEYLIICLLLVVLFSIGIRWVNREKKLKQFDKKHYVHEDEKGNLYIKVEDLNEVVEFLYRIERGER